jgi:hypothetical protein
MRSLAVAPRVAGALVALSALAPPLAVATCAATRADISPEPGPDSAPPDASPPTDGGDDGPPTDGGDGGPAPGDNVSGTRIRAVYLNGTDGSRAFDGWHDAQLGVDCSFVPAADGLTRCLPSGGPTVGNYYADAACTEPLASPCGGAAQAGSYATGLVPSSCPPLWSVYSVSVANPLVNPAMVYALFAAPDGCTAVTAPMGTFYGVTEVPASSFVAASRQVE